MKKFAIGFILGVFAPLVGIYLLFLMGGMPVATKGAPLPMERRLVHMALHAAMKEDSDKQAPFPATTESLVAGAKVYQTQCAGCHGLPDHPAGAFSKTMFPHVPQLFTERGSVNDDPIGQTYWKIKNGIRLTGMPAFESILSDAEIWQTSQLLSHTGSFDPAVQKAFAAQN